MEIIKMLGYGFSYAHREEKVLKDITFSVREGELILIAGDSGSGKSTFLKSLNGLIPIIVDGKMDGERYIKGKNMKTMPIHEISHSLGSVFQNPRSQFFTLNSTSELVFPMENYGYSKSEMKKTINTLKKEIPIENLLDRDILSLSSGERQLLALASAMVLGPDVLLFDEPSANLDYGNVIKFSELLKKLKSLGKTILVADHRFFYLNNLIDRVFLLEKHKIKIYENEEEFKKADYNTRNFDLFQMSIPFKEKINANMRLAELKNISKNNVLKNISLSFYKNEITAIVGINGAGKTTLAKLLTGSIKPDKGEIIIDKLPFYVMQDADYQLFGNSVSGEVELGNKTVDNNRKKEVLERLDIWKYRDTHPFNLSGGEKQRLQIAMASLSESEVLIFDEPTSGLDMKSMNRAVKEIEEASRERAVIIISHDYEFIRKIAHRIIHIDAGTIKDDFDLNKQTVERLNKIFIQMEVK